MSALKVKKLGYLAAATTLLALVVTQGCGSSDDNQAAPMGGAGKTSSTAGAGGKSSSTAGAGGKASTTAGATGKAGGDTTEEGGAGGAMDMGMGGEGGAGPDCTDPTGCYSCAPTTNIEFLNHCVEGGCPAHFDNGTLTQIAQVGTL
jgi:hypothetical protein